MGEGNEYTQEEVAELIYRVGDVIMDINLGDKILPEEYETGYLMLQTAHSMLGKLIPSDDTSRS